MVAHVDPPEVEPVANTDSGNGGGVEQLGEIFGLPEWRRPAVVAQPVQINQMDPAAPRRHAGGVLLRHKKVTEVQVFMEATAVVQDAGEPGQLRDQVALPAVEGRSEERRVGKEGGWRRA